MTPQEQNLIDSIFDLRVRNNVPWKKLIEIAMNHAPEETKAALRDVRLNDLTITDLTRDLTR